MGYYELCNIFGGTKTIDDGSVYSTSVFPHMRRDIFDKFFANSSNEDNVSSYEAPYFTRDPCRIHSRYSSISTQQQKNKRRN
jgi:hypothetical protein